LTQVDPGYTFGENDWSDEEMMRKFGIWYPVSALAFGFSVLYLLLHTFETLGISERYCECEWRQYSSSGPNNLKD
jgi:hypothetical protein